MKPSEEIAKKVSELPNWDSKIEVDLQNQIRAIIEYLDKQYAKN